MSNDQDEYANVPSLLWEPKSPGTAVDARRTHPSVKRIDWGLIHDCLVQGIPQVAHPNRWEIPVEHSVEPGLPQLIPVVMSRARSLLCSSVKSPRSASLL